MRAVVGIGEYVGWQRYWIEEPWGPWRDNLHMAVLAREVRRPQMKNPRRVDLAGFFYKPPSAVELVNAAKVDSVFAMLESLATRKVRKAE